MELPIDDANELNSKTVNDQLNMQDLIFIDVFAGSAKLSQAMKNCHLQVLPVDSKYNRHEPAVKCLVLDLTRSDNQEILFDLIRSEPVAGVNMGPPCGTSSRAREKPLPAWQIKAGVPQPQPLRDATHVLGFENLSEADRARVESANKLYYFCVELAVLCIHHNVPVSIENPKRSWAWDVMALCASEKKLQDQFGKLVPVDFQHCMYGGTRDKTTTMKFWPPGYLNQLHLMCDRSHEHASWGAQRSSGQWEFNTKQEAEYPKGLCVRIADLLTQLWQCRGARTLQPSLTGDIPTAAKKFKTRVATGKQPKGRSFPSLIPEFREVVEVSASHTEKDTKTLRLFSKGGESGSQMKMLGRYHTPAEFVNLALNSSHPMDMVTGLQDETLDTLQYILQYSPSHVARHRVSVAKSLMERRSALAKDESELHSKLPQHLQTILAEKNLLLFKELLSENHYVDLEVVDEMIAGFKVTGKLRPSRAWPKQLKLATMSVEEFKQRSVWANKALAAKCVSAGEREIDQQVWDQTIDEVQKGWLQGPFTFEQMKSRFDNQAWCASRRFPILQGQKLRLIDDAKESCLNDTVTTVNKLELMDTDSMVELATLAESVVRMRDYAVKYPNGEIQHGTVHSDWSDSQIAWVGRTLDLKSAYKQLGHHIDDLPFTIIAVFCPESQKPMFFESSALLFGSTASVYTFNRVARALWFLMNVVMKVLCLQFYDDYPMLDMSFSSNSAKTSAEFLLDVLGFGYATEGSKNLPFSSVFVMLGIEVDLTNLRHGSLIIKNKQQRVEDLCLQIGSFLETRKMSLQEAQSVRGKLQFMQGQYLGRSLKPVLAVLDQFVSNNASKYCLELLFQAMKYAMRILRTSKPKEVRIDQVKLPICVFTDGAYEPQDDGSYLATHGVVMFDPLSGLRVCHDGFVPPAVINMWHSLVGEQLIGQVELYPIIALRIKYVSLFAQRRVLYFIDNDSARDALIKGSSKSIASFALLTLFFEQEELSYSYPWFCRVPSSSNPADAPSRGDVNSVLKDFETTYEGPLLLPDWAFDRLLEITAVTDLLDHRVDNAKK